MINKDFISSSLIHAVTFLRLLRLTFKGGFYLRVVSIHKNTVVSINRKLREKSVFGVFLVPIFPHSYSVSLRIHP